MAGSARDRRSACGPRSTPSPDNKSPRRPAVERCASSSRSPAAASRPRVRARAQPAAPPAFPSRHAAVPTRRGTKCHRRRPRPRATCWRQLLRATAADAVKRLDRIGRELPGQCRDHPHHASPCIFARVDGIGYAARRVAFGCACAMGCRVKRYPVMYNDFVLIGPKSDPVKVGGGKDIVVALQKIEASWAPFVSRGDRSGTHRAELVLWQAAGIDIGKAGGTWYRDTGQGMGPALNTAAAMGAYILSDRGTWLAFKNRGDLTILVEGDKRLFNQYGVMLVNPQKHANVKKELGQQFIDWIISPTGQKAIADFKINGEQLFYPNATDPHA